MHRSLLVLAIASLFIVGCGKGNFSKPAASAGNVLRYPIPNKPTTFDPGKVQDGDTIDLLQQVYEGLVGWDENNQVSPRLAKSWDVSPDGKTYTFHLRPDAKFSNGRAVTASDFKWCIERNCSPKLHFQTPSDYLTDIVGVSDVIAGKATAISGIKVIDPQTLQINIDSSRPYFLGKLTYPVAFVFAKEAMLNPLIEMSDASEMIGTGGFKFDAVNPDTGARLSANPKYYEGKPPLDAIERPFVGDAATRLSMYKNGDIDILQLERQDAMSAKNDPVLKDQLQFFQRPAIWYIGFNCDMEPALKKRDVRMAMAMAIDKDNIIKNVLGGVNDRADTIIPPGVFGYRKDVKPIPFDPDGAKKLLAQAGYPGGQGIPELTMFFRNNRPDIKIVAEAVGQDLSKNLGIKVTFKAMEWGSYLELHNGKKLPFFHMRWAADYLDAQNFLSTLLASYGPENKINYNNGLFDELCKQADTSSNQEQRAKLYAQAEDLALHDLPFIPLYFQKDAELISPRVKNLRNSLFGHLPHTKVTVEHTSP